MTSLAKARAALLQLGHPKIATALAHHSTFETDPYHRVRITGQTMSAILFGSATERTEALRLLARLHATVRGTLPDGEPYRASDPTLLWFVLATLVDSDLLVEQRYVRIFDDHDRDAYYRDYLQLVDAFHIPTSTVPATRAGLRDYLTDSYAMLDVGPDAKRLSARIFEPSFLRLARPITWGSKHVLASLLPEHVRAGYGFERQPVTARLIVTGAQAALPRMPTRLRRARLQPRAKNDTRVAT